MSANIDDIWKDEKSPRANGCLVLAVMIFVIAAIGAGIFTWYWQLAKVERGARPQAGSSVETQVSAVNGRLTRAQDDGDDRQSFSRAEQPEIWYRVLLNVEPMGQPLELRGEWVDPNERRVHRHHFQTQPITHSPWETHVRYSLPVDAAKGTWHVRLQFGGDVLHEKSFEVK